MSKFGYANTITAPQRGATHSGAQASVKTIPFDYVFQFTLLSQRGNKQA